MASDDYQDRRSYVFVRGLARQLKKPYFPTPVEGRIDASNCASRFTGFSEEFLTVCLYSTFNVRVMEKPEWFREVDALESDPESVTPKGARAHTSRLAKRLAIIGAATLIIGGGIAFAQSNGGTASSEALASLSSTSVTAPASTPTTSAAVTTQPQSATAATPASFTTQPSLTGGRPSITGGPSGDDDGGNGND